MFSPHIPFADPHAAYMQRAEKINAEIQRVLEGGWYILGEEVALFEREFASWLQGASLHDGENMRVLGVANGTDALEVGIRGLETLRGAVSSAQGVAVFTVSHTAVATVAAIERAGAVPVLVDIDPHTLTMDAASLVQAIHLARREGLTPVGLIPVHIYGHPCHMDSLAAVAQEFGLWVLEDCAQAHGAVYADRMVGTWGDAAAFSHYPTKNLGALGDAGTVATRNAALADVFAALRQYGWKERYISALPGVNSRLDAVQAAILRVNLSYLDADIARRRALAAQYNAALADHGIVRIPHVAPWATHAWHLYVVRVPAEHRGQLLEHLRARGIGATLHYPQAVHQQPAYARRLLCSPEGLPVTTALYQEIITLPFYPHLNEAQVTRVLDAALEWRP